MTGTTWEVDEIVKVTDGDTLRLVRSRIIELDGNDYLLADANHRGVPIRLTWVDTPERGQPGYTQARDDLITWTETIAAQPLRVICYESGGFDRLLGDLIDADGHSASQWLMTERGWPPYVKGK